MNNDFKRTIPDKPRRLGWNELGGVLAFLVIAGLSAIPVFGTIDNALQLIPYAFIVVLFTALGVAGEVVATVLFTAFVTDFVVYYSLLRRLQVSRREDVVRKLLLPYVDEMGKHIFDNQH